MKMINILTLFFIIFISPLSFAEEPVIYIESDIHVESDIDIDTLSKELRRCDQKKIPSDQELEELIDKSSQCKIDSDCTNLFIGAMSSSFRCRNIPINRKDLDKVFNLIELNNREPSRVTRCDDRPLNYSCPKNIGPVFCNKRKCDFKFDKIVILRSIDLFNESLKQRRKIKGGTFKK